MKLKHLVCFAVLLLAVNVPVTAEAGLISWMRGCGWYGQYCGCCNSYGYGSSYRYAGYAPFYSSYGSYSSYYTPSYNYASYYTPSYNYASYYTPSYNYASYYTPAYSYAAPSYYGSNCSSCGFGDRSSYYGYAPSCSTGSCGLGGCCPTNCGNNCQANCGSYCPTNCGSNCQANCGDNCLTSQGMTYQANYASNCNSPLPLATEKNTGNQPTQANKTQQQQEQKSPDDGFGPRQNEPKFDPNDKGYTPPQVVPQKEGDTRQLDEQFIKLEQTITWQTRAQRTRLNLHARFNAPQLARKQREEKLVHWTAPTQTQPVSVTGK